MKPTQRSLVVLVLMLLVASAGCNAEPNAIDLGERDGGIDATDGTSDTGASDSDDNDADAPDSDVPIGDDADASDVGPPETTTGDLTAPAVTFIHPIEGDSLEGVSFPVQVSATDDVGVVRVQFLVDDVEIGTDEEAPWEATWDATGLERGVRTIRAKAFDDAGNEGEARVDVLYLGVCAPPRDCPPTVEFSNVEDGENLDDPRTIVVHATDDRGIERVAVFVDDEPMGEDETAPYEFDWQPEHVPEAFYELKAVATDTGGGTAEVGIRVVVDRSDPELVVNAPLSQIYHFAMPLDVVATDALGIDRVEWYLFEGAIPDDFVVPPVVPATLVMREEPWLGELDVSGLPRGDHDVLVAVFDHAGHSNGTLVTFTIDRPPSGRVEWDFVPHPPDARVRFRVFATDDGSDTTAALTVGGAMLPPLTLPPEGVVEFEWFPPREASTWEYQVTITDDAGQAINLLGELTIDHPPQLHVDLCKESCSALVSPDRALGSVRFEAELWDDDGEMTWMEFYVDDELSASVDEAPWAFEWDTRALPDGEHEVRFVAGSSSGETAETRSTVVVHNCDRDGDGLPSEACGGDDCDDEDAGIRTNACGGCETLEGDPGVGCGTCAAGAWGCDGPNSVVCEDPEDDPRNMCGGCATLNVEPGTVFTYRSGTQCEYRCYGLNSTSCYLLADTSLMRVTTVTLGTAPSDAYPRQPHEMPRSVTFNHDFLIDHYEVTQAEWEARMDSNPAYAGTCGGDCPVERVSWWDALHYANEMSREHDLPECYTLTGCDTVGTGCSDEESTCVSAGCESVTVNTPGGDPVGCRGYRLPTEWEWEYAARGGPEADTYNGPIESTGCLEETLSPIAWFCGNAGETPHPVGEKAGNAYNLHDVLGNVREWTWSTLSESDLGSADASRVPRGGGFDSTAYATRVSHRSAVDPGLRSYDLGFRLVRTVTVTE